MEDIWVSLAKSDIASVLRMSRWVYAAVNAVHIAAIGILFGSVMVLDLRLLGMWRSIVLADLARPFVTMAAIGLVIATASGLLLFATRADEYAALGIFRVKLALITIGTTSAIAHHLRFGRALTGASAGALRLAGITSLICWSGALLSGRLIAFMGE